MIAGTDVSAIAEVLYGINNNERKRRITIKMKGRLVWSVLYGRWVRAPSLPNPLCSASRSNCSLLSSRRERSAASVPDASLVGRIISSRHHTSPYPTGSDPAFAGEDHRPLATHAAHGRPRPRSKSTFWKMIGSSDESPRSARGMGQARGCGGKGEEEVKGEGLTIGPTAGLSGLFLPPLLRSRNRKRPKLLFCPRHRHRHQKKSSVPRLTWPLVVAKAPRLTAIVDIPHPPGNSCRKKKNRDDGETFLTRGGCDADVIPAPSCALPSPFRSERTLMSQQASIAVPSSHDSRPTRPTRRTQPVSAGVRIGAMWPMFNHLCRAHSLGGIGSQNGPYTRRATKEWEPLARRRSTLERTARSSQTPAVHGCRRGDRERGARDTLRVSSVRAPLRAGFKWACFPSGRMVLHTTRRNETRASRTVEAPETEERPGALAGLKEP